MGSDDEVSLLDTRRASTRVPLSNMAVTLEHEGKTFEARGGDFNEDCLSLTMDNPPPVGATVTVRCVDDAKKEVVFQANVVKHHPAGDGAAASVVVKEVKEAP